MRARKLWPALLLALALTGCAAGGGDPVSPGNTPAVVPEVSPSAVPEPVSTDPAALLPEDTGGDNALTLWYWDGETCQMQLIFQPQKGEILEALSAVSGRGEEGLTIPADGPLWGISIVRTESDFEAAWRDGVWSDSEGRVLRADLDFQAIWDLGEGEISPWEADGFPTYFPNQRSLALADGAWDSAYLSRSPEGTAPAGLTLSAEENGVGGLTCTLTNGTGEELFFGEDFDLQTELDGAWYSVPYGDTAHYGFNSIGLTLAPGEIYEFQPWLDPWLPLPDGNYRIYKPCGDGIAASAVFLAEEGVLQVP